MKPLMDRRAAAQWRVALSWCLEGAGAFDGPGHGEGTAIKKWGELRLHQDSAPERFLCPLPYIHVLLCRGGSVRNLEPTLMLGKRVPPLGDTPDQSTSCLTELIQAVISPSQLQESTCGLSSIWTPFQCSQAGAVRDTLGWPDSGKEPGRGL